MLLSGQQISFTIGCVYWQLIDYLFNIFIGHIKQICFGNIGIFINIKVVHHFISNWVGNTMPVLNLLRKLIYWSCLEFGGKGNIYVFSSHFTGVGRCNLVMDTKMKKGYFL